MDVYVCKILCYITGILQMFYMNLCSQYSSDGIGLLGGTITHFATCDDPPKVGGSFLAAIVIAYY